MRFTVKALSSLAALCSLSLALSADPPKPAETKEEAVKKDFKRLEGTWELVTYEIGGEQIKIPEDQARRLLIVKDGRAMFHLGTYNIDMKWTLDPTKTPKELDMRYKGLVGGEKKEPAIYELNGDELKQCSNPDGRRPRAMSTAPGSRNILYVFKRLKS